MSDLMSYIDSLAFASRDEIAANRRATDLIDALTSEVGGEEATFDVAWWLSLVLASRK